ncbi:nuclease-related domain-containing protein [Chiayiivirga flava]|uniref:R3H domain-containing protein n=1 Tax=Chiayiivirga flava TaxID=659595 RepID=A0A7W8G0P2_9GAMM|nr:hypothetical protein [Chiayiivirga flava]
MATLIPSRHLALPRMTAGERRTAHRLEDKLDDDYLAWFDVPIGPRQRQPDFVVLRPNRDFLRRAPSNPLIHPATHPNPRAPTHLRGTIEASLLPRSGGRCRQAEGRTLPKRGNTVTPPSPPKSTNVPHG